MNAANSMLLGGGGVDGAIHRAAGPELLSACKEVRRTHYPQGLPVGEAVITPGFRLPARFVIHTVGPNRHWGQCDPADLARCFTSAAQRALDKHCETTAFPAISAGVYGWDMAQVANVAVTALREWAASHPESDRLAVTFALFKPEATAIWLAALA